MNNYKIKTNNKEYDIYQSENNIFIDSNTLNELIFDYLKIKNENYINIKISRLKNDGMLDDKSYIKNENKSYIDVNAVYLILKELNLNVANNFIKTIQNANLGNFIWNYIIDLVNNYKEKKFNYNDFYLFEDAFQTLNKGKNNNGLTYRLFDFEYENEYDYLELLDKIKKENNLPEDFGELKIDNFEQLITDSYLKCDEVNTALNASSIFYTIIKEKPFVSYNNEIAFIIAIKTLIDTDSVHYRFDEDNRCILNSDINVSSSDLIYALKYVEENLDKPKMEVIKKIERFFCFKGISIKDNKKEELLSSIKEENSLDNIYRYIIYFTEHYHGYQGFYEFYKGKMIYCYKIHYHAKYSNFKFSYIKSDLKNNVLVFIADAKAYTEGPTDLCHRKDVLIDLYDEIKKRSYSYIMEKYLKDLKHELETYFDISKVQIIFDLKWIYEIDEDYEW